MIDGSVNTKITSALHPFDSTSPGNIINITGGTGFTVQRVQVLSVAGNVATCDKAVGTTGSTGGQGKLGGGLASISTATGLAVSKNTVNIKSGTYTFTSSLTLPNVFYLTLSGYGSAWGDFGTRPLVTTSTNSTTLLTCSNVTWLSLINLSMSNTAGTRADALTSCLDLDIAYCLFDGFTNAFSNQAGVSNCTLTGTEIKNCSASAVTTAFALHAVACWIHDNTEDGLVSTGNYAFTAHGTVFSNNGRYAVNYTFPYMVAIIGCVFYKNGLTFTGHPFDQCTLDAVGATEVAFSNNISYGGNSGKNLFGGLAPHLYGTNNARDAQPFATQSDALYNSRSDVTLTADPFTNGAAGDFSLNSTSGGGAALKAAGFPGVSPFGTGGLDIGAVQTASSPSSGGGSFGRIFSGY